MGWSDWRVPEMNEELELKLLSFELELRKEIHSRGPESLAARFVHQVKVIHQQEQIIHRASKRIAELEVALAAAEQPHASRPMPCRGWRGAWRDLVWILTEARWVLTRNRL